MVMNGVDAAASHYQFFLRQSLEEGFTRNEPLSEILKPANKRVFFVQIDPHQIFSLAGENR